MAMKFNEEMGGVTSSEMFKCDPFKVIVNHANNGRRFVHDDVEVTELAESMMIEGQLHPVVCRKIDNHRMELVLGFRRTMAAQKIREGFIGSDGEPKQDVNFMLKFTVMDGNQKDAFMRNVVENRHRKHPSPIDDAYNIARMADQWGMTNTQIGKVLQYDLPKISRLKKLVGLSDELQKKVHAGALSVHSAIESLDIPEAEREQIIAQIEAENEGKATVTAVRAALRTQDLNKSVRTSQQVPVAEIAKSTDDDHAPPVVQEIQLPMPFAAETDDIPHPSETADAATSVTPVLPPPKGRPRSLPEIKAFYQSQQESFPDERVQAFFGKMLEFVQGTVRDCDVMEALNGMLEITQNSAD